VASPFSSVSIDGQRTNQLHLVLGIDIPGVSRQALLRGQSSVASKRRWPLGSALEPCGVPSVRASDRIQGGHEDQIAAPAPALLDIYGGPTTPPVLG
jgi:hypothetical protein